MSGSCTVYTLNGKVVFMEVQFSKQQERIAVRKSLKYSIKDGVAFAATTGFGDNYLNPFAVALGASTFQIGLLSSASQFVPSLAQLKVADLVERFGSRKKVIVRSVFIHAFLLLPMAMIPYLPDSLRIYALIGLCALYVSFASFACQTVQQDQRP